jgi:aminopeptidase N
MIQTLIGKDAFRRGMDLYFARHDGQAVTCDDFVAAMADASGFDFTPFMTLVHQAGTPNTVRRQRQPAARRWSEQTIQLSATTQQFHIEHLTSEPVPSLLRDFSAPVNLEFAYTPAQLTHLLAYETDPFNAWEAGQRLASQLILDASAAIAAGNLPVWPASFVDAARRLLQQQDQRGAAFVAEALTLPGESTLAEAMAVVNPEALHAARNALRRHLAEELEGELAGIYAALAPQGPYQPNSADAGRRALRNLCLSYLLELDSDAVRQLAMQQFRSADNMTDQFSALAALAKTIAPNAKPPSPISTNAGSTKRWSSINGSPCNPAAACRIRWRRSKS